jgi:hypothetical protein
LRQLGGASECRHAVFDDACDAVHSHRQPSLFNAYYDESCFLLFHIYDTATGRPVAIILRPGKTPTAKQVRGHSRRIARRIRAHWPMTRIAIRVDGDHGRHEVTNGRAPGQRPRLCFRPVRQ